MSRVRTRMVSRIVEALSSRDLLRRSGFFTGLNLGIGALVGAVIVSFIAVTEWLTDVMIHGQALGAIRFAGPVLGALAAGFLMHRWFGEARGSGIPQTKAALVANDGRIPFRVPVGKYLCGVLTLGAGIPARSARGPLGADRGRDRLLRGRSTEAGHRAAAATDTGRDGRGDRGGLQTPRSLRSCSLWRKSSETSMRGCSVRWS